MRTRKFTLIALAGILTSIMALGFPGITSEARGGSYNGYSWDTIEDMVIKMITQTYNPERLIMERMSDGAVLVPEGTRILNLDFGDAGPDYIDHVSVTVGTEDGNISININMYLKNESPYYIKLICSNEISSLKIRTTNGNDEVVMNYSIGYVYVNLSYGNDIFIGSDTWGDCSITVDGSEPDYIATGHGNDYVRVYSSGYSYSGYINTGSGNDLIKTDALSGATVIGGRGDDTIKSSRINRYNTVVIVSPGSDTINGSPRLRDMIPR